MLAGCGPEVTGTAPDCLRDVAVAYIEARVRNDGSHTRYELKTAPPALAARAGADLQFPAGTELLAWTSLG